MKLFSLLMLLPQEAIAEEGVINVLVRYFNQGNEGGPFMWPILIVLIVGLAIAFERIITLNRADINTRKFILRVKKALEEGGIPAAEEVCARTRGPASRVRIVHESTTSPPSPITSHDGGASVICIVTL